MNSFLHRRKNLRQALAATYRQKEKGSINNAWQARVMRDIRNMDMPDVSQDIMAPLERMVWRFAPVACVLILVLAMVLLTYDFVPEYTLAEAFMDDSMSMVLVQAFGF